MGLKITLTRYTLLRHDTRNDVVPNPFGDEVMWYIGYGNTKWVGDSNLKFPDTLEGRELGHRVVSLLNEVQDKAYKAGIEDLQTSLALILIPGAAEEHFKR